MCACVCARGAQLTFLVPDVLQGAELVFIHDDGACLACELGAVVVKELGHILTPARRAQTQDPFLPLRGPGVCCHAVIADWIQHAKGFLPELEKVDDSLDLASRKVQEGYAGVAGDGWRAGVLRGWRRRGLHGVRD